LCELGNHSCDQEGTERKDAPNILRISSWVAKVHAFNIGMLPISGIRSSGNILSMTFLTWGLRIPLLVMAVHSYNLKTLKPGLHSEILSQKNKTKRKKERIPLFEKQNFKVNFYSSIIS
jgi:hypothetical protein